MLHFCSDACLGTNSYTPTCDPQADIVALWRVILDCSPLRVCRMILYIIIATQVITFVLPKRRMSLSINRIALRDIRERVTVVLPRDIPDDPVLLLATRTSPTTRLHVPRVCGVLPMDYQDYHKTLAPLTLPQQQGMM